MSSLVRLGLKSYKGLSTYSLCTLYFQQQAFVGGFRITIGIVVVLANRSYLAKFELISLGKAGAVIG